MYLCEWWIVIIDECGIGFQPRYRYVRDLSEVRSTESELRSGGKYLGIRDFKYRKLSKREIKEAGY